jgi:hypothetical protein
VSELTPCNFCSYERYRREAQARGATISLVPDRELEMLAVRVSDREEPIAWFLALTQHCVC